MAWIFLSVFFMVPVMLISTRPDALLPFCVRVTILEDEVVVFSIMAKAGGEDLLILKVL